MTVELVPERAARTLRGCRRLLLVGQCGAGKSTLARELAPRLGLPLIHLDAEFWRSGWVEPDLQDWRERRVPELLAREEWLMDGQYVTTLARRLERADGVLHLDLPRLVCFLRVMRRQVSREARPDLPGGCPERVSLAFLRYVWRHAERTRAGQLALLEEASGRMPVASLRDASQVERFLAALP